MIVTLRASGATESGLQAHPLISLGTTTRLFRFCVTRPISFVSKSTSANVSNTHRSREAPSNATMQPSAHTRLHVRAASESHPV